MNILMEVPDSDYRVKECVMRLHKLIQDNHMANFCVITSSSNEALHMMEKENATLLEHINYTNEENYIYVLYSAPEADGYGPEQIAEMSQQGVGASFDLDSISPELVEAMHQNGKIVCVWGKPTKSQKETDQFYNQLYSFGVDMIITEQPRKAHETLQFYHNKVVSKMNSDLE